MKSIKYKKDMIDIVIRKLKECHWDKTDNNAVEILNECVSGAGLVRFYNDNKKVILLLYIGYAY